MKYDLIYPKVFSFNSSSNYLENKDFLNFNKSIFIYFAHIEILNVCRFFYYKIVHSYINVYASLELYGVYAPKSNVLCSKTKEEDGCIEELDKLV